MSLKFEKFGICFTKHLEDQTLTAAQYWSKDRSQESLSLAYKGIFGKSQMSVGINVDQFDEDTKQIEKYLKLQYQLSKDTFQSVKLKQKNYDKLNTVLTHTHFFNDALTFGFQAQMNFDFNEEKFVNGRLLIKDHQGTFKMGANYSATKLEFAQAFFKFQLKSLGMKINYDHRKNTKEVQASWKQGAQTYQAGMQFNIPKSYEYVLGFMWSYEF